MGDNRSFSKSTAGLRLRVLTALNLSAWLLQLEDFAFEIEASSVLVADEPDNPKDRKVRRLILDSVPKELEGKLQRLTTSHKLV